MAVTLHQQHQPRAVLNHSHRLDLAPKHLPPPTQPHHRHHQHSHQLIALATSLVVTMVDIPKL